MPRPLNQQPDDKPVHEQVRDLIRKAHTDRMSAVGIVFSQKGYTKAQAQNVPGMQAFTGGQGQHHVATHYLGLPFTVSTSLTQGDVLLDLVPGGSEQARASRQANRDAREQAAGRGPVSFRVDHLDPTKTTMELAGAAMTAAQLCDVIRAWLDADVQKWGDFEKALDAVVVQHGRFE